jgi:ATP-dependent Lon protease
VDELEKTQDGSSSEQSILPVLPLRDVVVYPHTVIPLFVGRDKSIKALERAMEVDKRILLVAQKDAAKDDPGLDDIYMVGTVSNILQLLKLPDGTVKVLVEGGQRARIERFVELDDFFAAEMSPMGGSEEDEREIEILTRSALVQFEQYVKLNKKVPPEILASLSSIEDAGRQMEKSQREYYLNEQMKAIQKELGDMEDVPNEAEDLAKKIEEAGMTKEAKEKATAELNKLKMMSPMSAEATVVRNYIDWLISVPWKKQTKIRNELSKAEQVLEEDHYGLEKVKERILEYLAVQQRVKKLKGPILCLVGPPGVGKTSLGQSIARATNRKFIRMSLGGVRDEAEIRGHRRTYIGALPGKIIQNLAKVEVRNPLFLLDEVDKMSMDFRGDPSSALLEVLDPEQNHTFNDHYLEVDYDLSHVMFVATANTLNIPPPLLDRMEVIRLAGYTEDEKVNIAKRYLLPKQMKNNGLKDNELTISEAALQDIIRYYTREAGVRNVEREIAKICRKVVKEKVSGKSRGNTRITPRQLQKHLGVKRFRFGRIDQEDRIGQVTGLAWTEVGGDLLTIEAAITPGKGKSQYTGQLGDVMQESIRAAMTVVRSRTKLLGIPVDFYQNNDIHIHVPEGATPKDGPSAGVGMCTAIISALTKIPVRSEVAMTGEITLRGEVLPIGGLKEKLLAALRGGIKVVLIPEENERELTEIPLNIKQHLDIRAVKWIDQVLQVALTHLPDTAKTEKPEQIVEGEGGKDDDARNTLTTH